MTEIEKETARELLKANADNYDGLVKDFFFYQSVKELEFGFHAAQFGWRQTIKANGGKSRDLGNIPE